MAPRPLLVSLFLLLLIIASPVASPAWFDPVDATGLPYVIVVNGADLTLEPGDEVGVFDGDLCVGAAVFDSYPLSITAWEGNAGLDLPGFEPGNPIVFQVWDAGTETATYALGDYTEGDARFGSGFAASLTLESGSQPALFNLWCADPQVPAAGGDLEFGVQILSLLGSSVPGVAFWNQITVPSGQTYGPFFVIPFTHQPFMSVVGPSLTQAIPGGAPAGTYTFRGMVGFYPNPLKTDTFTFVKQGGVGAEMEPGDWKPGLEGDFPLFPSEQ